MSKFLTKVIEWLWHSSADSTQIGLTAKSAMLVLVGALVPILQLTHVNIGVDALNQVVDAIATTITAVLSTIGAIGFLVGLLRKVWLTVTGQNDVFKASV